jgi:hypothetical protein
MVSIDFTGIPIRRKQEDGKTLVFDPVRKRWLILTPEEFVRQSLLQYLLKVMHYPTSLIAIERKIMVGKVAKRYDLVVFGQDHKPWMLVECKEPEVVLTESALYQLLNYHRTLGCPYWVLTNGHQTFCADASSPEQIIWRTDLPGYHL